MERTKEIADLAGIVDMAGDDWAANLMPAEKRLFDSDRIVVLDAGRIAEQGSHDELMTRDGLYAAQVRAGEAGILA
jgi:hypothetical protein